MRAMGHWCHPVLRACGRPPLLNSEADSRHDLPRTIGAPLAVLRRSSNVHRGTVSIAILNPSDETMHDVVMPLLTEARDRLAAQRARNRAVR